VTVFNSTPSYRPVTCPYLGVVDIDLVQSVVMVDGDLVLADDLDATGAGE
jgi:hypothetical protein